MNRPGTAVACVVAAATITGASTALANGRFPAAGQIVVHPMNQDELVVRATYGILLTRTGGEPWSFLCEESVGFGGYQDPPMAYFGDGTLIAGVIDGLSVSHDGGCSWAFADGTAEKYVLDVSIEKVDTSRGVLVLTTPAPGGKSVSQLWESLDSGKSWAQAGVDMPEEYFALNVDVAPSQPQRVYASGRFGPPDYVGSLLRSDDRGQTWQRFDIPGSSEDRLPYLSAVHPLDPDLVYVRLDGEPIDSLVVSPDGGATWSTVFESDGNLFAFALSPDGAKVVIGGDVDGVWRADAMALDFAKVSEVGVKCFQWAPAGLYACADEFRDSFTAGVSLDEGATFTPLMHLQRLCGALACPAGTPTAELCPAQFGKVKLTLKTEPCSDDGGGNGVAPPEEPPADGCSCRSAGRTPGDAGVPGRSAAVWALPTLVAALGLWGRSRTARRARRPSATRNPRRAGFTE